MGVSGLMVSSLVPMGMGVSMFNSGVLRWLSPRSLQSEKMQHPNVEQEVRKNSSELGSLKRSELCLIGLL